MTSDQKRKAWEEEGRHEDGVDRWEMKIMGKKREKKKKIGKRERLQEGRQGG